jgi:hypothetical protein
MTRRSTSRLAVLILMPALLTHPAKAEGDTDGVTLSGLHANPAGSVKVAAATVALRQGMVTLTISAKAKTANATINVRFPPFKWRGEQDPYPDRQFPELQISIDNGPAALQDHSTADFAGANVTAELQQAGIDKFTISQSPPVLFPTPQNQTIFNQLLKSGAIEPLRGQDVAAWSAQRALSFSLAQGGHQITLTYNARPAITLQPTASLSEILPLTTYCLTTPALQRAAARAQKSGYILATQYAIPAGIDGDAGKMVALDLATPHEAAYFCAPNGKAVTAINGLVHAPAKPDAQGVVHVLTLGSAEK